MTLHYYEIISAIVVANGVIFHIYNDQVLDTSYSNKHINFSILPPQTDTFPVLRISNRYQIRILFGQNSLSHERLIKYCNKGRLWKLQNN